MDSPTTWAAEIVTCLSLESPCNRGRHRLSRPLQRRSDIYGNFDS